VRDHVTIAGQLPAYLGAYVGPKAALAPKLTEAIMLTMNSVDACPYCTGLHGELARMAGTGDETYASAPVAFAKVFAAVGAPGPPHRRARGPLRPAEARLAPLNIGNTSGPRAYGHVDTAKLRKLQ
jgi:AhpD family alkylhydroperoxidase